MTGAERLRFTLRWFLCAIVLLAFAGCSGGGGGGDSNRAPTAAFTVTPAIGQAPLTVTVNAAASTDADGNIANFSWTFGDGVTGAGVSTTHIYQAAGTFTIALTVTDNRGATAASTQTVTATVGPPPTSVTVSGRITFERVPFLPLPQAGLDYPGTLEAPAREIEVELLAASSSAVLGTTTTDASGYYSLVAPINTDARVRAKALSRFAGTSARPATWDLRVLNNTNSNALFVLDGAVFNTGVADLTRNLKATTGWGGDFSGIYSGTRAAAPFAILDTLFSAVQFVTANGNSAVQLPGLSAFWSPDNRPAVPFNPATGSIETTRYFPADSLGVLPGIYILGAADNDTDEFDQHVLAHEFQHFLEDAVSRTDSPGDIHSLSERLDMRLAFSEGFSNAFSGMVLTGLVDAPQVYRDSLGRAQGSDGWFDMETQRFGIPGWFSEASVHRIVWDLFDDTNDAADADTVTLGFEPMFDVMRAELRDGSPLTSLFSFVTAVKQRVGVSVAGIDARVQAEGNIVAATMDAYATTETNSGVDASDTEIVLPVYANPTLGGAGVRVCSDVVLGTYNKLGNRRFLRFSVPSTRTINILVNCPLSDPSCSGSPQPDPDFVLSRGATAGLPKKRHRSRKPCRRPWRVATMSSRFTSTVT